MWIRARVAEISLKNRQNAKIPHWLPVTKISFASFSARRGPPTPKLSRSRSWCLFYPEPKFDADKSCVEISSTVQTNKQTKQKANLISRQTLRYGEIIISMVCITIWTYCSVHLYIYKQSTFYQCLQAAFIIVIIITKIRLQTYLFVVKRLLYQCYRTVMCGLMLTRTKYEKAIHGSGSMDDRQVSFLSTNATLVCDIFSLY